MLAAEHAEFGLVTGWEWVAYFKPAPDFRATHSCRFTESFNVIGAEVAAIRSSVGLTEVNGFNRIEITGDGAHDWLEGLFCGRVPRRAGRVGLGYMLNRHGNVKAEATIVKLPEAAACGQDMAGGRIW